MIELSRGFSRETRRGANFDFGSACAMPPRSSLVYANTIRPNWHTVAAGVGGERERKRIVFDRVKRCCKGHADLSNSIRKFMLG